MSSQLARPRIRPFDPRSIPGELAGLRNLGPQSAAMLSAAGVRTRDELARLGAIGACARVQAIGRRVSLNLAYAIEGALTDCDWRALPHEFRRKLAVEFRRLRSEAPKTADRQISS